MNTYQKALISVFLSLPCLILTFSVHADTRSKPTPVLQVYQSSGQPTRSTRLASEWDMSGLKALPQRSFTTHTPWYQQPVTFTGPLVRDVLNASKVSGVTITAMALDEYKSRIPLSDVNKFDVILAHSINGEPLNPKNKGPLFIVYPFDSKKQLQSVLYYQRSVWQLKSLTVE